MKIIKKYITTFICSFAFVALMASAVLTYYSGDFIRNRDMLEYLNTDSGRFSVTVEESINELLNKNEKTKFLEWQREVDECEKKETKCITICAILSSLSIVALGSGTTSLIITKKKAKQSQVVKHVQSTSNAEELQMYKNLLDNGAITQDEYDAQKKQFLGL